MLKSHSIESTIRVSAISCCYSNQTMAFVLYPILKYTCQHIDTYFDNKYVFLDPAVMSDVDMTYSDWVVLIADAEDNTINATSQSFTITCMQCEVILWCLIAQM